MVCSAWHHHYHHHHCHRRRHRHHANDTDQHWVWAWRWWCVRLLSKCSAHGLVFVPPRWSRLLQSPDVISDDDYNFDDDYHGSVQRWPMMMIMIVSVDVAFKLVGVGPCPLGPVLSSCLVTNWANSPSQDIPHQCTNVVITTAEFRYLSWWVLGDWRPSPYPFQILSNPHQSHLIFVIRWKPPSQNSW